VKAELTPPSFRAKLSAWQKRLLLKKVGLTAGSQSAACRVCDWHTALRQVMLDQISAK